MQHNAVELQSTPSRVGMCEQRLCTATEADVSPGNQATAYESVFGDPPGLPGGIECGKCYPSRTEG